MTLIEVRNSDGVVGRCDARCYEAAHPSCDCICGGKNHGVGLSQARENTAELAEQWLDHAREKFGSDIEGLIGAEVLQGRLV